MKVKYTVILFLLLVGCSQVEGEKELRSVAEPSEAKIVEPTQVPTIPVSKTPTSIITKTPVPDPVLNVTETPTKEPAITGMDAFAQSNVAVQERGGVVVEIVWVLLGDKQVLEQAQPEDALLSSDLFVDKPVVAWIIFNITNNSGKEIHLHPRRGTVIVNDERIDLSEYKSYTFVDEKFDGSYGPGEKVIGGGVWFGIQHSAVNEINQMIVRMHGPHFPEENYYAKNYEFVLDLSDHGYEEFPHYLETAR